MSAMIWRTSGLRLAPPLITIVLARMPCARKRVDDVGKPIGEAAQAGDEQPLHAADVGVEIEPGDHRARIGIGIGRAVAEEFGQHMDVAREQRAPRRTVRSARRRARSRKSSRLEARGLRGRDGSAWAGCDRDEMVDRRRPPPTGRPRSARGRAPSPRNTAPTRPARSTASSVVAMMQADVPMT